jgi:hypothetical protein
MTLIKKPSQLLPPPPPTQTSSKKIVLGKISDATGHRIVLYGPGGIGKSTLAVALSSVGPVAVVDSDDSLPRLRGQLSLAGASLPGVVPAHDWASLRSALQSDGWGDTKNVVLDSITKIEEWCTAHVIATIPNDKGHNVKRIEDYGYGKGYQHIYETFLLLLGDLDRLSRRGMNVVLIAHECVASVPNPEGEDWIRYEPRLQSPTSGKGSIRLRVKEWCDHMLFLGYDVAVKDGIGRGSGTRTIYTTELPFCMAKSRTTQEVIPLVQGHSPWPAILK